MPTHLAVAMCSITGVICFFIGALVQQQLSYIRIRSIVEKDAYIYRSREILFNALGFLWFQRKMPEMPESRVRLSLNRHIEPTENTRIPSQSMGSSLVDKILDWGSLLASVPQNQGTQTGTESVSEIMKYGFPGMDEILTYGNFVVSYDRRNRIAHWVCERVCGECFLHTDPKILDKPNEYITDENVTPMFSPTMRDFRNTDWVGAHMASPQNNRCDFRRFYATYMFPNIVPIHRGLKSNIWQRLEHYVRRVALKSAAVYVYSGPMFMPQRITFRNWAVKYQVMGMNTIAVPTHFFKVIISEPLEGEMPRMEGYVVPNADLDKNMDLRSFLADIRDIEHFAGLKFYDGEARHSYGSYLRETGIFDFA